MSDDLESLWMLRRRGHEIRARVRLLPRALEFQLAWEGEVYFSRLFQDGRDLHARGWENLAEPTITDTTVMTRRLP